MSPQANLDSTSSMPTPTLHLHQEAHLTLGCDHVFVHRLPPANSSVKSGPWLFIFVSSAGPVPSTCNAVSRCLMIRWWSPLHYCCLILGSQCSMHFPSVICSSWTTVPSSTPNQELCLLFISGLSFKRIPSPNKMTADSETPRMI